MSDGDVALVMVLEDGYDRERWEKTGMLPLGDVYERVFTITKVSSREYSLHVILDADCSA